MDRLKTVLAMSLLFVVFAVGLGAFFCTVQELVSFRKSDNDMFSASEYPSWVPFGVRFPKDKENHE